MLVIPVMLWGKPCVISKGEDGVSVALCSEEELEKASVLWRGNPESKDLDIMFATKRGQIIEVFADEEVANTGYAVFEIDLRSEVLMRRDSSGKMSATASPFTLVWNDKYEVTFRFDDNNQLLAVVNGKEMSLVAFVEDIPNSDKYLERVTELLE